MGNDLDKLQNEYMDFLDERNWSRYHRPKSIAMSVAIEAAELMELFQWDRTLPVEDYRNGISQQVADELADVLLYSLSLANEFDIDLIEATSEKLKENRDRFDEDKVAEINDQLNRSQ